MLPQRFEFFKDNSFKKESVERLQNKTSNHKSITKVYQIKYTIALF